MARFFKRPPSREEGGRTIGSAGSAPRKTISDLKPDPDRIGISGSVPFVRLPHPATLFAQRAERFRALAPGHPLAGYLDFLARIADGQARLAAERAPGLPSNAAPMPDEAAMRMANGMPPLARSSLSDDPAFLVGLDRLLATVDLAGAPDEARAARDRLCAASSDDRLDLMVQVFEGAFPIDRMAECVFVAAGLQVILAEHAAVLDGNVLAPVADGVCPVCGGAPSSSLIVSWTPADKARYLSCSLCGTLWNHVRIRCTACGSGEGISYYGLNEVSKDVQVETCTTCHSYLKHLHQHRDPALDPIADDVASYGLDLKIAEDGFRKAGLNPLFVA